MTGPVAIDMAAVRRRKRDMVDDQIAAHLQNYKASAAELIMGSGRFVAPKTLEVSLNDGGTRLLAGDLVFLDLGTHAAIPHVGSLEAAQPLTHVEALELDYLLASRLRRMPLTPSSGDTTYPLPSIQVTARSTI